MSVLPSRLAGWSSCARRLPEPAARLLACARLAAPDVLVYGVVVDAETVGGTTKTVLVLRAARAVINKLVLLSPSLSTSGASPYGEALTIDEPAFPWWTPGQHGDGERYAYDTPDLDLVEVFVPADRCSVYVRAYGTVGSRVGRPRRGRW